MLSPFSEPMRTMESPKLLHPVKVHSFAENTSVSEMRTSSRPLLLDPPFPSRRRALEMPVPPNWFEAKIAIGLFSSENNTLSMLVSVALRKSVVPS